MTQDTDLHDARIREAFDALAADTRRLDAAAALARTRSRRTPPARQFAGMAAAALLAVVGLVGVVAIIGNRGSQGETVVAAVAGEAPTPQPPATSPPIVAVEISLADTTWILTSATRPDGLSFADDASITLAFDDANIHGGVECQNYLGRYSLDGATLQVRGIAKGATIPNCGTSQPDTIDEYLVVLAEALRVQLRDAELVLEGESTRLEFTSVPQIAVPAITPDPSLPPVMSVEQLVAAQRVDGPGTVPLQGLLMFRDGAWIMCSGGLVERPPQCTGRWVVITNYDAVIDPHLETTEPRTALDNALDLAVVNGSFDAEADVVWSNHPYTITGSLTADGRFAVAGWPTEAEVTDADRRLVEALRDAARSGAFDPTALRFAPSGVRLGLGPSLVTEPIPIEDLVDQARWVLDLEGFRGYTGRFSAVDLLARDGEVTILAGPHDHCASPPAAVPAAIVYERRLSIQPAGVDGCLQWSTIDLFLDASDHIVAITLDLWEP